MAQPKRLLISYVVPAYNEASGLSRLQGELLGIISSLKDFDYEIIYCDDGSSDNTSELVSAWHKANHRVKLIRLSRNFGKESALAAGITAAMGEAVIMLDADGQHPVERIPDFISAWQDGAEVVVGVRTKNSNEGWFKRYGSILFYKLFNLSTRQKLTPQSSDFRLIDAQVRMALLQLPENDRITRGLIDWLGFKRQIIKFKARAREHGTASYSLRKLLGLAANSFVSLTTIPLYTFGFLGVVITLMSLLLGLSVGIEQLILDDPLAWNFTGTAMLGILILFMVGIVLMSQGMLALYISRIHNQSRQRPLYVVDYKHSAGIENPNA